MSVRSFDSRPSSDGRSEIVRHRTIDTHGHVRPVLVIGDRPARLRHLLLTSSAADLICCRPHLLLTSHRRIRRPSGERSDAC
ncbi:hypothetical protein DQP55_08425 [Mycolicibacterium sp. GF69]|nr:hypothetical protein DQP55_08425 [Mycolicibacterium sp. GF69]